MTYFLARLPGVALITVLLLVGWWSVDHGGLVLAQVATATPRPTLTPFEVTPTPLPADVFAAATLVTRLTAEATITGTPTDAPDNMVVATRTPTPRVVTATPTAENEATAALMVAQETAIAVTTGTPYYVTATPTPLAAVAEETPTPTPIEVTPTPLPLDVFAAATLVVQLTADASSTGTATSMPDNVVVSTRTPTPRVVTATPTAENEATAALMVAQETAIAATTGTPYYVTATPTSAATQVRPTNTPTPQWLVLSDLTPTPTAGPAAPFPAVLIGKILFLADQDGRGGPEAYAMNPDGSELWRLTSLEFYTRAVERDAQSADRRYRAFTRRTTSNRRQLAYHDREFESTNDLTQFGAGVAWAPSWSPVGDVVAFVSNESRGDEIWVVRKGEWPAVRLTDNTWEWDHHPSWSPDGTEIVFSSNRITGVRQLWIMRADGAGQRLLVDLGFEAWDPVWVKFAD